MYVFWSFTNIKKKYDFLLKNKMFLGVRGVFQIALSIQIYYFVKTARFTTAYSDHNLLKGNQ